MARKNQHVIKKASPMVDVARSVDLQHMTATQLRSYIQNEGKRLNQQIVEIEKRGLQTSSFAYEKLTSKPNYSQYLGTTKSGHTKINLATRGLSRQELQKRAKIIEKFAGSRTITVSGIKEYNKNVTSSLRAKYPAMSKLSDEQLLDILKTQGFAHMKATVGSDVVMKMIASAASPEAMIRILESAGTLTTVDGALKEYERINKEYSDGWEPVKGFNPFESV